MGGNGSPDAKEKPLVAIHMRSTGWVWITGLIYCRHYSFKIPSGFDKDEVHPEVEVNSVDAFQGVPEGGRDSIFWGDPKGGRLDFLAGAHEALRTFGQKHLAVISTDPRVM
ncbi:hypothetical protein TNIN_386581 [Trichonephila inaurata madagascariensis]|uniref:Uncharacterized protein n=1 Tax=Trichonephila inaurata madagascariensis TaxID=2747483 RepID=A0A8X7C0T5_9ARAC|nr:hypothetical protein TNIN_386581 [Trichonephila inaurata madagascariensis]